jgi:hypothetical protein
MRGISAQRCGNNLLAGVTGLLPERQHPASNFSRRIASQETQEIERPGHHGGLKSLSMARS